MPAPLAPAGGGFRVVDPAHARAGNATGPAAVLKGRGTAWAIAHRFQSDAREVVDDGWGTLDQAADAEHVAPQTQIIEEQAKRILSTNDSPDINFDVAINPYRGCEHGCIYCFARPTHSYLNMSPGLDFETRIIAKVNAAERLRETLAKPGYVPSHINIGSATDAYQPIERKLGITRSLIEVLAECRHAFAIVTKSSGVERDLDLVGEMGRAGLAVVYMSITTLDSSLARIMEPRATAPQRRLRTIEALARAGVPVGVSASPMIPFINEPELERILAAARDAGATSAFCTVLRLPWEVNPLFQQWLEAHFPDRAARVMGRVRDMRRGKDYDAEFGTRMRGTGVWAQMLRDRFNLAVNRLGFSRERYPLDLSQFVRPVAPARRSSTLLEADAADANRQRSLF
ncbi:MAG: PA0069 family radical SAM protein [Burkholderiaceae bacterium]